MRRLSAPFARLSAPRPRARRSCRAFSTALTDNDRIPVTILTGYLGSGKTTLLNRLLSENHGSRLVVIENEFGEIGIDDDLVRHRFKTDEDIFVMNNGCMCCTVRSDLVNILGDIFKIAQEGSADTQDKGIDGIVIETTGLADPSPVARTFFEGAFASIFKLDAVVTVVDACHIERHLAATAEQKSSQNDLNMPIVNEAVQQILFASTLLLNKAGAAPAAQLQRVKQQIRALNAHAPIMECDYCDIPLKNMLNSGDFELSNVRMEVEAMEAHNHNDHQKHDHAHDHAHNHAHDHVHDSSVFSVSLQRRGAAADMDKLNEWLASVLQTQHEDIFRMKGVIHVNDEAAAGKRLVVQSVHSMFQGDWINEDQIGQTEEQEQWSRIVFIGQYLHREGLQAGFDRCFDGG